MAVSEPFPTPVAPRPDPYAAWRIANYRLYALSWFAMTMARQIEFLAVGIYLYGPNKDVLALGWQGLVMALPAMLLAIAGGQLADRFDRRWVLATMLCLTAADAAALGVACNYHLSAPWIYLLLVLNAVGQALGAPSRTALLPWIVPPEQFAGAVAWNSTVYQIGTMVGPAVGGLLLWAAAGQGVPFALGCVVLFRLLGLAGTLLVRTYRPDHKQSSISLETLVAGIRFVRSQKPILATISLDLFAVLLGGATFVLPAFADQVLHVPDAKIGAVVGYLRSAEAVGAILMAVLLAHLPPIRHAGRTMLWAVAGFGAATVCLGLSQYSLDCAGGHVLDRGAGQHQRRRPPHAHPVAHAGRHAGAGDRGEQRLHRGLQRIGRHGVRRDGRSVWSGPLDCRRRGGGHLGRVGMCRTLAADPLDRLAGRPASGRRGMYSSRSAVRECVTSVIEYGYVAAERPSSACPRRAWARG